MTATLAQLSEFCTQAGQPLTYLEGELYAGREYGADTAMIWRVGPTEAITECAECSSTIGTGETIIASVACMNQRPNPNSAKHATWHHVRCHNWSERPLIHKTAGTRSRRPGPKVIEKELFAAVSSPRFRLELRSGNDLRKVADRTDRNNGKSEGNRVRAIASVADRLGIDPDSPASVVIAPPEPIKVTWQNASLEPKPAPKPALCYHGANHCGVLGSQVCSATPRKPRPIAPAPQSTQAPEAQKAPQPSSGLPQWAEEWLAGLVFETKRDYARQFLAHLLCDAPAPIDPATEWAEKARKRARRLAEIAA